VERCQGFASTSPPQESVPFSYTHRPGRSGSHGPAGSWVDFPIPQNSFVWVLLKIGSRASKSAFSHNEPRGEGQSRAQSRGGPRNHPVYQYCYTFVRSQAGRCSARSFLIYPPAGAQWPPRPGGLLGGFPNPAKLICMGFAKNRLASSHTRRWRGRSPRAWESARGHAAAVQRRPGRWASSPSGLPYTYPTPRSKAPALHLPADLPYTPQPTYPTPAARPAPPDRPTLHLPSRLPYTLASRPTYPTPLFVPFTIIDTKWRQETNPSLYPVIFV